MLAPLVRIMVRLGVRAVREQMRPSPEELAAARREAEEAARRDPMRWIRRTIALVVLVVGWMFIVLANKFHISAPVVFVCLGYLAVVATVMNLWRTGAAAVAPDDAGTAAWAVPIGPRGELDKEKRVLLKAIKEAEFDHQMGKLSKADADEMIGTYRARAIEVIKEMDRLDAGQVETVRDQIQREVRARLEVHKVRPKDKPPAGSGSGSASEAT